MLDIQTLIQVNSQLRRVTWLDFPGKGKSYRTHIGYAMQFEDGRTVNIPVFETNTNAKQADIAGVVYALNSFSELVEQVSHIEGTSDLIVRELREHFGIVGDCDLVEFIKARAAVVDAARHKRATWERLGKCQDEFTNDLAACSEYAEQDDDAQIELNTALAAVDAAKERGE